MFGEHGFLDFIASFFSAENRAEFYITNDSTTALMNVDNELLKGTVSREKFSN